MRLIVLVLLALVLLGGGGAGAYFYFMKPAKAAVGGEVGENHEKLEEEKKAEKEHSGHYEFVELDPLILPIVDDNGVSQVISMVVALEVADVIAADQVKAVIPKIKDAFIQDMYGMLNRHAALKGGVIQVNVIKKRLNMVSNKVLGEDVVHDVLLQVVQQRPI